jgi:hypothetical protein
MPVDYLVVISNPHAFYVIKENNIRVRQRVCKADVLLKRVQFFEKLYTKEILTTKGLRKLSRLFIKKNTPPTSFLLQKYGIQKSELLNGVCCPTCNFLPIIRDKKKWYCPSCKTFSIKAHEKTLLDYFLLYETKITNQQFREFARIKSPDLSGSLLRSSNLSFSGSNKGRIYFPKTVPW